MSNGLSTQLKGAIHRFMATIRRNVLQKNTAELEVSFGPILEQTLEESGKRGEQFFNVRQEGLVGDGVVDDAPALQALVTKLKNLGGGVVYLPSGTYKLDSAIDFGFTQAITMYGDNIFSTSLDCSGNASGVVFKDVVGYCYFRDFTVINIIPQLNVPAIDIDAGPGAPGNISFERVRFAAFSPVNSAPLVRVERGQHMSFEDCEFYLVGGVIGTGLLLENNCDHIDINNCYFYGGDIGLKMVTQCKSISVSSCKFGGTWGGRPNTGIYMDEDYNINLTNCLISAVQDGIYLAQISNPSFGCVLTTIDNVLITAGSKDIRAGAKSFGNTLINFQSFSAFNYSLVDLFAFKTVLGGSDISWGDDYPNIIKLRYEASDAGAAQPTVAALNAAFGSPGSYDEGLVGVYKNTNAGDGKTYHVSTDNTNWFYVSFTQAV